MAVVDPIIYQYLCSCIGTHSLQLTQIHGGSINNAFKVSATKKHFFCKINSATKFPHLFKKEAEGLMLLEKQGVIHIPKVIDLLQTHAYQCLLLEWIEPGTTSPAFWKTFGESLAHLHTITQESFGLDTDNYMGAIPQANTPTTDWNSFFIHQRLEPLVLQCYSKQYLTSQHLTQFHQLYKRIPIIFHQEPPALLHGDLWNGNFICSQNQQPVLIDPAVYFGHRAVDLGMTTLFGGFDEAFYEAYHFHYPLPANYKEQWAISNLYPLLIHLLLFGKSYLSSIERTLNDFQ